MVAVGQTYVGSDGASQFLWEMKATSTSLEPSTTRSSMKGSQLVGGSPPDGREQHPLISDNDGTGQHGHHRVDNLRLPFT